MQQETNSKIAKQASSIVTKLATTMTATALLKLVSCVERRRPILRTYRRKEAGIQCAAKVWSVVSEGGGTETYGPMRPKRNETKRNGTERNETKATPCCKHGATLYV